VTAALRESQTLAPSIHFYRSSDFQLAEHEQLTNATWQERDVIGREQHVCRAAERLD
jgi:hypothetical protein